MKEIQQMQMWVDKMPEGVEREWWERYIWLRKNAIYLGRLCIAAAVAYMLLAVMAPWKIAAVPLAVGVAGFVLLLLLNIIRSNIWNRKFSEG